MAEAAPAPLAVILPYSNELINNTDNIITPFLGETLEAILMPRDTTCGVAENPNVEDPGGDDEQVQALLDDDVPSSLGTPIGIPNTAFDVISNIITAFITPYNDPTGPFDRIKCMIHSLFFGINRAEGEVVINKPQRLGFVGLTRAGPGRLSEYTATIFYAANDSYLCYEDIIKINLEKNFSSNFIFSGSLTVILLVSES